MSKAKYGITKAAPVTDVIDAWSEQKQRLHELSTEHDEATIALVEAEHAHAEATATLAKAQERARLAARELEAHRKSLRK